MEPLRPAESDIVNVRLDDDYFEPRRKTRHFIPWLPKMYWLFYRKPYYFLIIFASIIPGTIYNVSTWVSGRIVDSLSLPNPLSHVKHYAFMLFCYCLFSACCTCISHISWIRIGSRIGIKLRRMVFKSFMEKDITFFDTHAIGDMLTLLGTDSTTVESAFTSAKTEQARFLGQVISCLILTFSINWKLASLNFFVALMSGNIVKVMRKVAVAHMDKRVEYIGESTTIASEALSNPKVVFAFNRQKREIERFEDRLDEAAKHDGKFRMYAGTAFGLSNMVNWGTIAVVLNLGCYYILEKKMTTGQLFQVARASFLGGLGLRNLLGTLQSEQVAMHACDRIFEVIENEPEVPTSGGRRLNHFQGRVEFRNVWFRYPTRPTIWVLKNVSFVVEAGEIAAIVGHSGSGKSTLLQLLLRFYDVDEGDILFDDVPLRELDPRWVHQVVGVVQQEPMLFAMSVRDNIRYSVSGDVSDEAIVAAARIAHADEFIHSMEDGYDSFITAKGDNLSGGQRQRIAIARAVIRDPTILITDEATSALDAASEKEVQVALDAVMKGRTSLIIAHRLGTIRAARMIYVLESGELVEEGTHEELIEKQGYYAKLVRRQLEMGTSTSEEQLPNY